MIKNKGRNRLLESSSLAHFLIIFLLTGWACSKNQKPAESAEVWQKIKIDFKKIDNQGLTGPKDGKVAVHYEFCIPAKKQYFDEIRQIDSTAEKYPGKGRINCTSEQWLIVGVTHQPRYLRVLYDLASKPWISEIREVFWE